MVWVLCYLNSLLELEGCGCRGYTSDEIPGYVNQKHSKDSTLPLMARCAQSSQPQDPKGSPLYKVSYEYFKNPWFIYFPYMK